MTTLMLIILIIACAVMELNPRIDTDNIIGKGAVLSIVLGAGLCLFDDRSDLTIYSNWIVYSATIYFAAMAYEGFMAKHNRRRADGNNTATR